MLRSEEATVAPQLVTDRLNRYLLLVLLKLTLYLSRYSWALIALSVCCKKMRGCLESVTSSIPIQQVTTVNNRNSLAQYVSSHQKSERKS
jgi:hypothetical protein